MSNRKERYRHLTEEKLKKYLNGELKGEEAHEVERLMLESPFEAEAMEGWEAFPSEQLAQDMQVIRQRLATKKPSTGLLWLRIAASIALLLILGISIWLVTNQRNESTLLAEKQLVKEQEEPVTKSDSNTQEISEEDVETYAEIAEEHDQQTNEERPLIAQKKEKQENEVIEESFQATISAEPELAEVIVEDNDQSLVADMPTELIEIDEIELDLEIAPEIEIPENVPTKRAIATAKPTDDREQNVADSQLSNAKMAATGAVSRSTPYPTRRITGIVKDAEESAGLPGVNVIIEGTNQGTVTDLDGRFEIQVDPENEMLIFSFIGFEAISQPIQDSMIVIMDPDVASLSEVVVTGYGIRRSAGYADAITEADEPYEYQPPLPIDGKRAYKAYIEQNLRYPSDALTNKISGTVKLRITIRPDGQVDPIQIVRGLGHGCDEESIRLIKEGPEWTPAEKNGEKISSEVVVKIKFKQP